MEKKKEEICLSETPKSFHTVPICRATMVWKRNLSEMNEAIASNIMLNHAAAFCFSMSELERIMQ